MREFLIKQLLKKYKPRLVVVFGRHGREEARRAINTVLGKHSPSFSSSAKSFIPKFYREKGGFLGIVAAFISKHAFPYFCIVEADPDGEFYAKLRDILGIDLAVVTAVGDIPSFSDVFAGAKKYSEKIAREARKARHIVYTYDDETIRDLISDIQVSKKSYGYDSGSDIRLDSAQNWIYIKQKTSGGITLKVEYEGSLVPFNLLNCYGKRNIYASCIALGAAQFYEINLISASQDLSDYIAPWHSLRLKTGIKSTAVVSHTKNVTPLSAREAIEILGAMADRGEVERVILVLGDILLRVHEEAESLHRVLGEIAAHNVNELVLAGERVIFSEQEALAHGMEQQHIVRHSSAKEAIRDILDITKEHDAVLVLGSEEMGLNKIIDEIRER